MRSITHHKHLQKHHHSPSPSSFFINPWIFWTLKTDLNPDNLGTSSVDLVSAVWQNASPFLLSKQHYNSYHHYQSKVYAQFLNKTSLQAWKLPLFKTLPTHLPTSEAKNLRTWWCPLSSGSSPFCGISRFGLLKARSKICNHYIRRIITGVINQNSGGINHNYWSLFTIFCSGWPWALRWKPFWLA